MRNIHCTNCRQPYPQTGVPYKCPKCGGVYDFEHFPAFDPSLEINQTGIWRYLRSLCLPGENPIVTLGEGNTPLLWSDVFGKRVGFKCEFLNPTGSYKDRGAATLLSFLLSRDVSKAIEDSSGNAGAAFAAYAARCGLKARVYIPDSTTGPKRMQIEFYGAEVIRILGARSVVAEKARQAAAEGFVYASHAYLPHVLPGYATIAYEIFEQFGEFPGTIIAPTGQGNLLLAVARGFEQLAVTYQITKKPVYVGVQAQACAPLWALFRYGPAGLGWVSEGNTLAEGVRVRHPIRGDALLQTVEKSGGLFVAVAEENILPGRNELAHRGFYVEPTSALVWDALAQVSDFVPEPIIVILTGSGFKYQSE